MRQGKILAALLALLLCLPLCACGQEPPERDSVSLWLLAEDPLLPQLESLTAEYNTQREEGLLAVSLRAFPDETALAAAFDTARPDLLLCSRNRAAALAEQELLRSFRGGEAPADPYPAEAHEDFSPVGSAWFPLGARVPLLLAREDAWAAPPADWNALLTMAADYGAREGLPFFTADSFAALFRQALAEQGAAFTADLDREKETPAFVTVYNALAEAAYQGGLLIADSAAVDLVRSGALPCALADTAPAGPCEGCAWLCLPGADGTRCGQTEGLALTVREGRDLQDAAAFLAWLTEPERLCVLALDSGLVPALDDGRQAADQREALLLSILRQEQLREPETTYEENRAAFEAAFRRAMRQFP